jgi:hypothetical protein
MDQLVNLLIMVVVFGSIAYGLYWVLTHFKAPLPVFWIVGVILLIFLLYFLMGQFGGGGYHLRFGRW